MDKIDCETMDITEAVDNLFQQCENGRLFDPTCPIAQYTLKDGSVDINNIPPDYVIINVPVIYVNCNEYGKHISHENLRCIRIENLKSVMSQALNMESTDDQEQMRIFVDNMKYMKKMILEAGSSSNSDSYFDSTILSPLLELMCQFNNTYHQLTLEGTFHNVARRKINFDVIRRYRNDTTTGVLKEYRPSSFNNLFFYTQLLEVSEGGAVIEMRKLMNDSDLNRYYYVLNEYIAALCMEPERVCYSTKQYINICILFMILEFNSLPIYGRSDNGVLEHYLMLSIDCYIRSRIINQWKHLDSTKPLINDIILNYDPSNILAAVCKLDESEERAKYVVNKCKAHCKDELTYMICNIDVKSYFNLIKERTISIGDEKFYLLNKSELLDFLMNGTLKDILSKISEKQNSEDLISGLKDKLKEMPTTHNSNIHK